MANTMQQREGALSSSSGAPSTVADKAGEVGAVVADEAKGVARDAMLHARQAVQGSRESLRSEATNQAARMATTLRDIGGQLQSMTQGQSDGVAVDVGRQLAGTATRVADRLESGGLDAALRDVKGFARRRPGLFLLGALGAGFAAGRLIKAADTHSLMEVAQQRPQQPQQITGGDEWPAPPQSSALLAETAP